MKNRRDFKGQARKEPGATGSKKSSSYRQGPSDAPAKRTARPASTSARSTGTSRSGYDRPSRDQASFRSREESTYESRQQSQDRYSSEGDARRERDYQSNNEHLSDSGSAVDEGLASMYIYGRRSVAEALKSDRELEKIFVEYGVNESGIKDIIFAARKKNIPMVVADKKKFRQLEQEAGATNYAQGIIALSVAYQSVEDHELFTQALEQSKQPLLVALDGINDPHNLGAIARSIVCAGAQGLLLPIRNSAPVSSAALKTAAGAFEYLPVAKTTNLGVSLERAKEAGFWIIGTDADATHSYTANLYDRPVLLIIGSEGSGLRVSTRKLCDAVISIPLQSKISSLNASVAAGVVLFEVARQRALEQKI